MQNQEMIDRALLEADTIAGMEMNDTEKLLVALADAYREIKIEERKACAERALRFVESMLSDADMDRLYVAILADKPRQKDEIDFGDDERVWGYDGEAL